MLLLGTLGASFLGKMLPGKGIARAGFGKGIVRAGSGVKKGKGIVRVGCRNEMNF